MDVDVCSLCGSINVDCGCLSLTVEDNEGDMVWTRLLRQQDEVWTEILDPNEGSRSHDTSMWHLVDDLYEKFVRSYSSN